MESNVRARWEKLRDRLDAEAQAAKCSQEAVMQLSHRYTLLQSNERAIVDVVLAEWLESADETKRFDAESLIWDHRIGTAMPALKALARRLERSKAPGAPYELKMVQKIINALAAG